MSTDLLYLRDAYLRSARGEVVGVEGAAVALDRTVLYPTGGGQPHDTGAMRWDGGEAHVTAVRKQGDVVWHEVEGDVPAPGAAVEVEVDWERRHRLMRTHTALHVLCGVIWNEWGVPVTGGNMEPLTARMDFQLDPTPEGFGARVEQLVAAEIAADRPIEVSFLPRSEAVLDQALIRTKVSLVPESVPEIRVVDIVGLDKQADGGTHVRSTSEVGGVRVVKTESKGKGNKRVRIGVTDACPPPRPPPPRWTRCETGSASWAGSWSRSPGAPTRPSSPGWPTTPSATTVCWRSPRCRRRCRAASGSTAPSWPRSGACAGARSRPTRWSRRRTPATTPTAATGARTPCCGRSTRSSPPCPMPARTAPATAGASPG